MKKNICTPSIIFATLIILLIQSCGNDDLPKYNHLDSLRILGIQANTPEVNPGATVTLTAVISDYAKGVATGVGSSFTYTLTSCLDFGVAKGAPVECTQDPTAVTQTGSFNLSGPTYTGSVTLPTVTVPSTIFAGRSSIDQFNGVGYLNILKITRSDGESLTGYKIILASTQSTKNSNPVLNSISRFGSPLSKLPTEAASLTPDISQGAESYIAKISNGDSVARTEKIFITWFVSVGDFSFTRTSDASSNDYTPDKGSTKPVFLVPVIHDDRGGTGFLSGIMVGP